MNDNVQDLTVFFPSFKKVKSVKNLFPAFAQIVKISIEIFVTTQTRESFAVQSPQGGKEKISAHPILFFANKKNLQPFEKS